MKCVIGVDLGGTNVRAQAIDREGKAVGPRCELPSRAQEGTEVILDALTTVIRQAASGASIEPEAVGLAIPGFVDDAAGMVRWAPNFGHKEGDVFHYWKDVPIGQPLRQRLNLPVHMGNDANLAALGEYMFGSGKGTAKCLVMITIGTGIGGGIVMAPTSLQGDVRGPVVLLGGNLGAAELGHILVNLNGPDCNAGSYGALEAFCQRDAIITRARHKIQRGRPSTIYDLVESDLTRITPRIIFEACEKGDEVALEVYEEIGTFLGAGLGTCINIFAPDVIAIGGQIAKAGEYILGAARKSARNVAIPALFEFATIGLAEQLDDAGILGAAALAMI